MIPDEGYIKYRSFWTEAAAPDIESVADLEAWRQPLHAAGLLGHYSQLGVGYGNISVRGAEPGQFLISGTQTGHLKNTTEAHYSLVTAYDIDDNTVRCVGPVQASSEAMTHAALYEVGAGVGAIVHVHSRVLWQDSIFELPTTAADIPYGTPQMAREFQRLYAESSFAESGIAVMAGHEDGLISLGTTLAEAATRVLTLAGFPAGS